jgi:hypothetical protein
MREVSRGVRARSQREGGGDGDAKMDYPRGEQFSYAMGGPHVEIF